MVIAAYRTGRDESWGWARRIERQVQLQGHIFGGLTDVGADRPVSVATVIPAPVRAFAGKRCACKAVALHGSRLKFNGRCNAGRCLRDAIDSPTARAWTIATKINAFDVPIPDSSLRNVNNWIGRV